MMLSLKERERVLTGTDISMLFWGKSSYHLHENAWSNIPIHLFRRTRLLLMPQSTKNLFSWMWMSSVFFDLATHPISMLSSLAGPIWSITPLDCCEVLRMRMERAVTSFDSPVDWASSTSCSVDYWAEGRQRVCWRKGVFWGEGGNSTNLSRSTKAAKEERQRAHDSEDA